MDTNDEYDYGRIHRDFQKRTRKRDHGWTKGLVLGLVLGVMLCTGTTYAFYVGELAYESAMQYDAPAPPLGMLPPRIEQEDRNTDGRNGGNGMNRVRRGWGNSRGPNLTAE